jgi:hypothetical protein
MFSIFTKFEQRGNKKKRKKKKKKKNEQPWILAYTLVLQTMSYPLSFFFFFLDLIDFASKMMPCRQNHNWICFGHGPLSKGLGTNLKTH